VTQPKSTVSTILRHFFKKLNAPYRLSITNTASMEESFSFQLTKKSVYLFLTSLFVGIFIFFSLIIFFTPVKYYVPGLQQNSNRKELFKLQNLADSLIKVNKLREGYVYNLLKVVNGGYDTARDTTMLSEDAIKAATAINENKIDRASRYDYLKNQRTDTLGVEKKDSILIKKNQ